MIQPSALNVIIVGLMVIVFGFFWRMLAVKLNETAVGQAMSVIF